MIRNLTVKLKAKIHNGQYQNHQEIISIIKIMLAQANMMQIKIIKVLFNLLQAFILVMKRELMIIKIIFQVQVLISKI
jgi:hypothetical protein